MVQVLISVNKSISRIHYLNQEDSEDRGEYVIHILNAFLIH